MMFLSYARQRLKKFGRHLPTVVIEPSTLGLAFDPQFKRNFINDCQLLRNSMTLLLKSVFMK